MPINQYLEQKYGFSEDAQVPTSFLEEELHLEPGEIRPLVKQMLNKRNYPAMITFSAFVGVCSEYLSR